MILCPGMKPAGADFTIGLHGKIEFHPGQVTPFGRAGTIRRKPLSWQSCIPAI